MRWLIWSAAYLTCHLLLYAAILRHAPLFSRERIIFRYHLFSAAALVTALLGVVVATRHGEDLSGAVGALSLHGIYSMSFLELWSLAQGGYSLGILEYVVRGRVTDLSVLLEIGAAKKQNRLESLQRLWLVRRHGEDIELTGLGRLLAGTAWVVARSLNLRQPA